MQISEAESRVMAVLWEHKACTADEVVAALDHANEWQETTVKTLLNRLLKKGAISADVEGRRYRYVPVLQQSDWVLEESSGLLDRLFGGRVAPLVAHFSEHGRLSRNDIAELRQLVKDLDDEQ
ncbi:MAG: BlaI/MecI/CopY family transcriptional regulator [Pseudomarimonas sp.]